MASVDDEIDRLEGLSIFELRTLWRRHWKKPPPMRLSKDMLIRGVAWKLQEQVFGGIGKPELRKLTVLAKAAAEQSLAGGSDEIGNAASTGPAAQYNRSPTTSVPTTITLREGNRLVREWNGTTHTVLVLASGFEWQGRQYRSLSQIAEAITGAHWSGPRFFGLTKRKAERKVVASNLSMDREPDRILGTATGRGS
jgi:Protein of unknown function (DUF2924)